VTITEKKYLSELERTLLHKDAYEKLERISATFQSELEQCQQDLEQISNEKQRTRRKGFVNGLIWGAIAGGVLGILVDASLR
jgi:ferric-dicitrate binding protein FerR (iron transport regulator)